MRFERRVRKRQNEGVHPVAIFRRGPFEEPAARKKLNHFKKSVSRTATFFLAALRNPSMNPVAPRFP